MLRRQEDRALEAIAAGEVQKLRVDFGWEGKLEGEGVEGIEMEFNVLMYDVQVGDVVVFVLMSVCGHDIEALPRVTHAGPGQRLLRLWVRYHGGDWVTAVEMSVERLPNSTNLNGLW